MQKDKLLAVFLLIGLGCSSNHPEPQNIPHRGWGVKNTGNSYGTLGFISDLSVIVGEDREDFERALLDDMDISWEEAKIILRNHHERLKEKYKGTSDAIR